VGGFATTVFTNEGFAKDKKYYAVVPPCPEAKDFMMIAKAGGKSGHRTSEGVKVFERNKGYNVGDALKDVADYVTDAIDEDGVANALARLGLV
jgi:hypothetical protein